MSTKWDRENMIRLTATYSKNNEEHLKAIDKLRKEMKEKNFTFSKWLANKLTGKEE